MQTYLAHWLHRLQQIVVCCTCVPFPVPYSSDSLPCCRMSPFTCARRSSTAEATSGRGTPKSPPCQGCTWLAPRGAAPSTSCCVSSQTPRQVADREIVHASASGTACSPHCSHIAQDTYPGRHFLCPTSIPARIVTAHLSPAPTRAWPVGGPLQHHRPAQPEPRVPARHLWGGGRALSAAAPRAPQQQGQHHSAPSLAASIDV